MAYIKNEDPNGVRYLTDHGLAVESGEWAEVSKEVAEELAKQSVWTVVHADGSPVKAANSRAEHEAEAELEEASAPVELSGEPEAPIGGKKPEEAK